MKTSFLAALIMLSVMVVAVSTPAAHAATVYQLKVTVTVDGQSGSTVLKVLDVNEDGVVTVDVSSSLLSEIQGAFGTTEFVFPGSYTGTFDIRGHTVTVTLQSDDSFTLNFI